MADKKEKLLIGYPKLITYECTKKIIEQMESSICKIKIGQERATGFFCKIPFPDEKNMLSVFITNNHVIDEDLLNKNDTSFSIFIKEEKEKKEINLNNRMKYTNKDYDTTIIEINEKDNIKNYLELDENIINSLTNNKANNNNDYEDKTLYIIQYPEGELSVSYGILNNICLDKKHDFNHSCSTNNGSSGSPILNIINNKIIGIHKESGNKNFNKGTFLNYPIKEFIQLHYYNNKINKKEFINNEFDEDNKLKLNDNNKGKPIINQMSMNNMNNYNQITKEFILCKEDEDLIQIGCNFVLENNNIYIWRTTMRGPENTPYEGGIFTIRIIFPSDYPNHGPEFRFINKVYHVNVDNFQDLGHISLNSINEWRLTGKVRYLNIYTVKQALFDIFQSFYSQDIERNGDESIAKLYENNREKFYAEAKKWTKLYANMSYLNL